MKVYRYRKSSIIGTSFTTILTIHSSTIGIFLLNNMSLNTRILINPLLINLIIRTFFLYLVIPIIKDLLYIHVNCKKAIEHIILVILQAASKAKILSRILLSLEEKQMFEQNISVEFKEKLPILILHCLGI